MTCFTLDCFSNLIVWKNTLGNFWFLLLCWGKQTKVNLICLVPVLSATHVLVVWKSFGPKCQNSHLCRNLQGHREFFLVLILLMTYSRTVYWALHCKGNVLCVWEYIKCSAREFPVWQAMYNPQWNHPPSMFCSSSVISYCQNEMWCPNKAGTPLNDRSWVIHYTLINAIWCITSMCWTALLKMDIYRLYLHYSSFAAAIK